MYAVNYLMIVMNAILIGADHLGNIPELLSDCNINIPRHITGRHVSHQRKQHGLPRNMPRPGYVWVIFYFFSMILSLSIAV